MGLGGGLASNGGAAQIPSSVDIESLVATSYTYNTDGTVATATKDSKTSTYSYNSDGTVHAVARGDGHTETYSYNGDGTVAGSTVV